MQPKYSPHIAPKPNIFGDCRLVWLYKAKTTDIERKKNHTTATYYGGGLLYYKGTIQDSYLHISEAFIISFSTFKDGSTPYNAPR